MVLIESFVSIITKPHNEILKQEYGSGNGDPLLHFHF